jgi:ubiquinone/menaquinone biosynthesis C-methylase UbiE
MIASHAAQSAAHPFDAVAPTYDEWFEQSTITQAIRKIVHTSCAKYFHSGDHVLELNCGTGTDALFLTSIGIRVTATDASPSMIERARSKLSGQLASGLAEVEVMEFGEVQSLREHDFDGVFSNFGGLNCAREPERVLHDVALRLKPDGVFIACLMNRRCAWEMMSFFLRGKFREAGRRRRQAAVKVGQATVPVTYYTPRSFSGLMSEYFIVEEIYGLNILSPGPNSRAFVAGFPGITKFLLGADRLVRGLPPFSGLGDHFVVVGRRRS